MLSQYGWKTSIIRTMNEYITSVLSITCILIGYVLGRSSVGESTGEWRKSLGKKLSKLNPLKDNRIGAVERPTAQEIKFRDAPWLKEEDEAMTSVLDELNKTRK